MCVIARSGICVYTLSHLGSGSVLVLAALSHDGRILCATMAHCRCILDATAVRWQAMEAFWNKQNMFFTNFHHVLTIFIGLHFLVPIRLQLPSTEQSRIFNVPGLSISFAGTQLSDLLGIVDVAVSMCA